MNIQPRMLGLSALLLTACCVGCELPEERPRMTWPRPFGPSPMAVQEDAAPTRDSARSMLYETDRAWSVRPISHTEDLPDRAAVQEPESTPAPQPVQEPQPLESAEQAHLQPLPVTPAAIGSVPLTLTDCETIALTSHPAIERAAAQLAALRGKYLQVGLYPNPTIGYSGQDIGDLGTAGQQGGYVRQTVVLGGKLGLNREVVSREVLKAQQQLATQEQRVLTDVRVAFYDTLVMRRRVEVVGELVKASTAAVATSKRLYEAKEIPVVGVLQTEIAAQNARVLLQQAESQAEAAARRLVAVLGQPVVGPLPLEGDLSPRDELEWESQLQRILVESPEMSARAAELERARWAFDRALVQATPNVDVQVGVNRDNAARDTLTQIQVELPIPLWDKNQGGIQQARSNIVAAELDLERMQLALTQRLADAFQRYQVARNQVRAYDSEILPKAQQNFDLVRTGYDKGQVGNLDLLTAQRLYFEAVLARVNALQNLWRSRLQIEGMLLQGGLTVESTIGN